MASWREIEQDAPEFAARVRGLFEAGTNKTLATLRRDGSPRISASELEFSADGDVTLGMMPGSRRLLDVRRDSRVALHSPGLGTAEGRPQFRAGRRQDGRLVGGDRPPARQPSRQSRVLQAGHHRGGAYLRRNASRSPRDRVLAGAPLLAATNSGLSQPRRPGEGSAGRDTHGWTDVNRGCRCGLMTNVDARDHEAILQP